MFGDSGIRLVSILVGIIFIAGLIIIANRFGTQIRQRFQQNRIASVTVTPTPVSSGFGEISGDIKGETNFYSQTSQTPDTGAETLMIPALVSLFGLGLKLRKSR